MATASPSVRPVDFSGYRLLEKIGEGGTGQVYRAVRQGDNRPVALKILRRHTPATSPLLDVTLDHPHIVPILESRLNGPQPFLVMELVEGGCLRQHLRPGVPWTLGRSYRVIECVADALQFLHGLRLLHLDLKPENVLCDEALQIIKISDFGLATPCNEAQELADLRQAQGSPDYAAPEQRFGLRVDERTDLFALATLAYEMLTGRLPGRVHIACSRRNPLVPVSLDDVVRAGLKRDAGQRPESVADFRRQFNEALGIRARVLQPEKLAAAD